MNPKTFDFSIDRNVGVITLNRPQAYNALTFEVYKELTGFFEYLNSQQEVRAVVLTGKGKAFCSGGDVREIIGPLLERGEEELLKFTRMTCELIWNMRMLERPIVAALNGVTAGAGAMLAIASDFRIAADTAKIAFLFVRVGLSGADMGACYLLPKIIGLTKATELLMLGNFISAEEAARIGLYNEVVPADQLHDRAMAIAQKLAEGPSNGIAVTKRQINQETLPRLRETLDAEAAAQAKCMLHSDYKEGFQAFVEKRQPQFKKD